mgnify:FL=1
MSPVSMKDTAVNYDLYFLVPTMWFQGDRASPTTHFLYIFRTQILLQQQNHLQNEKKLYRTYIWIFCCQLHTKEMYLINVTIFYR